MPVSITATSTSMRTSSVSVDVEHGACRYAFHPRGGRLRRGLVPVDRADVLDVGDPGGVRDRFLGELCRVALEGMAVDEADPTPRSAVWASATTVGRATLSLRTTMNWPGAISASWPGGDGASIGLGIGPWAGGTALAEVQPPIRPAIKQASSSRRSHVVLPMRYRPCPTELRLAPLPTVHRLVEETGFERGSLHR